MLAVRRLGYVVPDSRMKDCLQRLHVLLVAANEPGLAARVKRALGGSEAELEQFLRSNELWGGAGSIADQAGMSDLGSNELRKNIEGNLIDLGRMQLEAGLVNPRTQVWTAAFEQWRRTGVR